MSATKPETVLIVEDDAGVARLQRMRLERAGYAVRVAPTSDEALEHIRAGGIDLLVLDYRLSATEDGLAFYARLKAAGYDPPVIMVTGYGDDATIVRALRAGVRDYIFKSVEYLDYLPEAVARVLDQVRVRRELAVSQALARGVLDSLGAHIAVLDRGGVIVAVNEAWDRFARSNGGSSQACGPGTNYLDVCRSARGPYADEAPAVERGIRAVLDGTRPSFTLEYPCPWLTVPRWFAIQVTRLLTDRTGAVVSHTDITERKRAEEELREERDRFTRVAAAAPGAICSFQRWPDGRTAFPYASPGFAEVTGVQPEQVAEDAAPLFARIHPDDVGPVSEVIVASARDLTHISSEYRLRHPVKGEVWLEAQSIPERQGDGSVLWYGVVTDVTARKRAEVDLQRLAEERKQALADLSAKTEELKATTQQLWQAARLAGVGELAASIAHELNNPLATVSLRIEGVLAKTPADDPRRKPLEIIEGEVERMARLVSNLLNFSRAGRDQVSTVDVGEEIVKTIELTDHHLRKRQIRAATEFAPAVPSIHADRQQLRQVFLNLFTNAADAMSHGGRLVVRVRPAELLGSVPAVAVEVADTGSGIPPEHLARVSEAFFTTKEEGKGTGLGLAICKRIVHQHHGTLEIESTAGVGTTVRITLPVRPDTNVTGLRVEPPALL